MSLSSCSTIVALQLMAPTHYTSFRSSSTCSRDNLEMRAVNVDGMRCIASSLETPAFSDAERHSKVDSVHIVLLAVNTTHSVERERAGRLGRAAEGRNRREQRRCGICRACCASTDKPYQVPPGSETTQRDVLVSGQRAEVHQQVKPFAHPQFNLGNRRRRAEQSTVVADHGEWRAITQREREYACVRTVQYPEAVHAPVHVEHRV